MKRKFEIYLYLVFKFFYVGNIVFKFFNVSFLWFLNEFFLEIIDVRKKE